MKAILLVVDMPPIPRTPDDRSFDKEYPYSRCIGYLAGLSMQNTNVQLLGQNVVLIRTDNIENTFAEAIYKRLYGVPYKYLVFEEEPKWREGSE